MKIQSAYLQNQIPENTRNIKRKDISAPDQFEKIIDQHKTSRSNEIQKATETLKLNDVTQRVLSKSEKQAISTQFNSIDKKFIKTYSHQGKPVTMEVMIGKKIDIKG